MKNWVDDFLHTMFTVPEKENPEMPEKTASDKAATAISFVTFTSIAGVVLAGSVAAIVEILRAVGLA